MTAHPWVGRVIAIERSGRVLHLDRLVHQYPGKRLIFRGHLADGEPVAAKFYLGFLRQGWEWLRGLRGARLLQRSGVASPNLHHAGYCREATAWLAVFDWIEADEPWPPSTWPLARADHRRLIEILAAHHHAGVVQKDMNWRNFIPRCGRLYTVDTDRVSGRPAPLNRARSLARVTDVYASKSRIPDHELHWAYNEYCDHRGWQACDYERLRFIQGIRKARVEHARMVARRSFRGWKHYRRFATRRCRVVFDQRAISSETVEQFVAKHCASAEPESMQLEPSLPAIGMSVHAIPELRRRSAGAGPSFVRKPTARHTWLNNVTLRRLAFAAPKGVALIEDRGRQRTWLISEKTDVTPLASSLIRASAEERGQFIEALRDLLVEMKKYRILNRAWRLDALGWDGDRIWLLDVSEIRFHPWFLPGFDRRWQRELEAFLAILSTYMRSPTESLRLIMDPPDP